jgi:hypothetical protein
VQDFYLGFVKSRFFLIGRARKNKLALSRVITDFAKQRRIVMSRISRRSDFILNFLEQKLERQLKFVFISAIGKILSDDERPKRWNRGRISQRCVGTGTVFSELELRAQDVEPLIILKRSSKRIFFFRRNRHWYRNYPPPSKGGRNYD